MKRACPILSFVGCPALHCLSTLFHQRQDFRNKMIEHKMCVLVCLQLLSEVLLILRRTECDVTNNVHRPSCKGPFILVHF